MDSSSFITSKSTKDIIKDAEESVAFLDSMLAQSDAFEKAHALYRSDDGEDANSDSMIEAFECKGYTDANVISDSNASGADLSESQSSGPLWESYRMEKDNRATMESGNGDENDVGSAFNAMLRDLCNDIMYFSLRMCDVTHTKLCKISSALKVCREKSLDESNSITEGDGDFSSSEDSQCSHQCMQITRVAIAVDTIRLLLSRYDERKVVAALTTSTRKVLNRFTLESGVEPLVGFPATLTTTNIATVLLDARRLLVLQNSSSNGQWMSMQSRKNVKKSETRSPKQASADRNGKVHIGSHKDTGTTHPSPQSAKRSILHRDGDHILLKEHLFRYQSRPKAQYGLSNFKISSQPNDTSSTAAIRRQKAMQFSKKLSMQHKCI
uniref:AlNc14C19G2004 protein n=1 Tax=Albugo laibachii Nc14 TaxID=890382 RepID=F0W533_9STRA|nr:AlNc14C19G2004 [Albugo laibachii Nc14]|eukprot:CCA16224.1 AlNc14C19G2004 [Albugo laibachii Nc14]